MEVDAQLHEMRSIDVKSLELYHTVSLRRLYCRELVVKPLLIDQADVVSSCVK